MRPSVYIETSIVSYLVARSSRDPLMAERQRQTREWWDARRSEYRLFSSELVHQEAGFGEAAMARKRIALIDTLSLLRSGPEAERLAAALIQRGPLPAKARSDASHISLATVGLIDYLLTWNCKHIANPKMFRTITRVCWGLGYAPPVLCTPDELLMR
jgi:hypothetical protein